jgi:biopolymer transport protein ExbB
MWGHSLETLFFKGGWVMWPILGCSIVAVAIALERMIFFFVYSTSYEGFTRRLKPLLQSGDLAGAGALAKRRSGPLARAAESYLEELGRTPEAREEIVGCSASQAIARLERRLHWLSIIGVLAPMLGLLGTVDGLVEAFNAIDKAQGQVEPRLLAAGIWAALLTTVFGLIVALPTLAVYHVLENRLATLTLEVQWVVARMNQWLHLQPGRSGDAGSPPLPENVDDTIPVTTAAG